MLDEQLTQEAIATDSVILWVVYYHPIYVYIYVKTSLHLCDPLQIYSITLKTYPITSKDIQPHPTISKLHPLTSKHIQTHPQHI